MTAASQKTATGFFHSPKKAVGYFESKDLRCFYTGLPLITCVNNHHPLTASLEHLVPVCSIFLDQHNMPINIVPAATLFNSLVGNAPLSVKFGLKAFLETFTVHPALDEMSVVAIYKKAVQKYLNQFKRHGQFFWSWSNYQGKKNESETTHLFKKLELYKRYLALLTEEELAIGAYIKWKKKA